MYIDDYRDFNEEETNEIWDYPYDVFELETCDLPNGCPYRQLLPPPPFGGFGGFGGGSFGGGPSSGAPTSPPPSITPSKQPKLQSMQGGIGIQAVDPGSIRPCTFRFVYIWPTRGRGFWAWLTFVGRRSASGFRWNGRRWVYFGIDLRRIESFVCY